MEDMLWKFPHIGQQIFNELNDNDLTKSREISQSWRKFIDEEKISWNRILLKYPCRNEQSPLHIAALTGQYETYVKLADNLKDINPKDQKERTPLHFAAERGHFSICQWIISKVRSYTVPFMKTFFFATL